MQHNITFKKTAGFLLTALITGGIYLGVIFLLKNVWPVNTYVSITIAYTFAMVFYFIINKVVIFNKVRSSGKLLHEVIQFAIVSVINYFITLFCVWLFKKFTGEIYSGSVVAGIITTALAYIVFDKIFS